MARTVVAVVVVLCVPALGCGRGGDAGPASQVRLTVTDGFGARTLLETPTPEVRAGDTVLQVLERNADVQTGGGTVRAIAGRSGGWRLYVNGVREERPAARVEVHEADRIWWDRAASAAAAVVGSFPEPFVNGLDGERRPTRLECDEAVEAACDAVADRLAALDVVAGRSRIGTEQGEESLRILVGLWPQVRGDRAAEQLEQGPRASGVYARIAPDGRTITALDPAGSPVRRFGPGTALLAATRFRDEDPVWIVTGTDAAGVRLAAEQAFDESVLNEKYALAVADGLPVPLPVRPR